MFDKETVLPGRRTQRERSESMQQRVLKATLQCLGQKGYRDMALHDIAERAGISRGAITHHYLNKSELVSEAIRHYFEWRRESSDAPPEISPAHSVEDSLEAFWQAINDDFAINFEIIVALRNDPELLKRLRKRGDLDLATPALTSGANFPELSSLENVDTLIAVIAAFYRGLIADGFVRSEADTDEMRTLFNRMISDHLRALNAELFAPQSVNTLAPPSARGDFRGLKLRATG